MDFLIPFAVIFVCAVLAFAQYFLQSAMREKQDIEGELTWFHRCLVFMSVALAFVAYLLLVTCVLCALESLLEYFGEYQYYPNIFVGLASFIVATLLCYSIWLGGWEFGRSEGLRSAEKSRRNDDSANH